MTGNTMRIIACQAAATTRGMRVVKKATEKRPRSSFEDREQERVLAKLARKSKIRFHNH